jgi:hypothetical protein
MLCKASPFRAETDEEVDRLASEAAFEFPEDIAISPEGFSMVILSLPSSKGVRQQFASIGTREQNVGQ